jgi:hypothetical protein
VRTHTLVAVGDIELVDNVVRDAGRHGMAHYPGLFVDQQWNLTARIHRNAVARSATPTVFANVPGTGPGFASFLHVQAGTTSGERNEADHGTVLLGHNHGDGRGLGGQARAVYLQTTVLGASANHVVGNAVLGFEVRAREGLFTDNLTQAANQFSHPGVETPPNVLV